MARPATRRRGSITGLPSRSPGSASGPRATLLQQAGAVMKVAMSTTQVAMNMALTKAATTMRIEDVQCTGKIEGRLLTEEMITIHHEAVSPQALQCLLQLFLHEELELIEFFEAVVFLVVTQ